MIDNKPDKLDKPRITLPSDEDRAIADVINAQLREFGAKVHPVTAADGKHMLIAEYGSKRENWVSIAPFEVGDIIDDVKRWIDGGTGALPDRRWAVTASEDDFL
jgi:hypothetical protein